MEDGLVVDHENHDKLDCRKDNLRLVTYNVNGWNRKNVHGVYRYVTEHGRVYFCARIRIGYKKHHLGTFKTYNRAKIFADRARSDLIAGATHIRVLRKRKGVYWPNLEKTKLEPVYLAA